MKPQEKLLEDPTLILSEDGEVQGRITYITTVVTTVTATAVNERVVSYEPFVVGDSGDDGDKDLKGISIQPRWRWCAIYCVQAAVPK